MTFEHNFTETFTTTVTRAVGPTTLTGARGTLPEPTPTDANAIFLAPNGDDGDAGTEAAPKLTVAGAVAALTPGKPTVHIFRNGFVGDLEFTLTASLSVPTSRNIQVEEGERAKITAGIRIITVGGGSKYNL